MSFQTVCSGCGAISSPSVGVCPYCKTVMNAGKHLSGGVDQIAKHYNDGNLAQALAVGYELQSQNPKLFDDSENALLLAQVMLEAEAPSSKIRALLVQANAAKPGIADITDYLEILEAKSYLRDGPDPGESMLRNILRRSPENVHAHFLLGSHIFWTEHEPMKAIADLETCVRLRPQFLRAWACLGALYKQLGNAHLSRFAFEKCILLESDPTMKDFFKQQVV